MEDLDKLIKQSHIRINISGFLFFIILGISVFYQFHSDDYFIVAHGLAITTGVFFLSHVFETLNFKMNLGNRLSEEEKRTLSEKFLLDYSRKNRRLLILFLMFFVGGVYFLSFKIMQWDTEERLRIENMNKNPDYTIAKINEIEFLHMRDGVSSYRLHYEFIIDNVRYKRHEIIGDKSYWSNLFPVEIGDTYRLQYEEGNVDNHRILPFEPHGKTKLKLLHIVINDFDYPLIHDSLKIELLDSLESHYGFIGISAFYGLDENLTGSIRKPVRDLTKQEDFKNLIERFENK